MRGIWRTDTSKAAHSSADPRQGTAPAQARDPGGAARATKPLAATWARLLAASPGGPQPSAATASAPRGNGRGGADEGPREPNQAGHERLGDESPPLDVERGIKLFTSLLPPLTPPSFVTVEWLRSRAHTVPRKIRVLQENADAIRNVCPMLRWPEGRRTTTEAFLEAAYQGFAFPALFQAMRSAYPKREGTFDLFGPFILQGQKRVAALAASQRPGDPPDFAEAMGLLVTSGETELARDTIMVWGACTGMVEESILATENRPELAEVRDYLLSVRAYWERIEEIDCDPERFLAEALAASDDAGGAAEGGEGQAGTGDREPDPAVAATEAGGVADPPRIATAPHPRDWTPGMVDAAAGWTEATSSLALHAATLATIRVPSATALAEAELALGMARAALGAFEAARPRMVDAAPYLARAAAIIAAASGMGATSADAAEPDNPGTALQVAEALVGTLEGALLEADGALAAAAEARAEEDAIWDSRDPARVGMVPGLVELRQERATAAAAHARAALGMIASAQPGIEPASAAEAAVRDAAGERPAAPEAVPAASPSVQWASEAAEAAPGGSPPATPELEDEDEADALAAPGEGEDQTAAEDAAIAAIVAAEALVQEAPTALLEAAEEPQEDPEFAAVADRLRNLHRAGEFPLAWHLARAAERSMPEARLPYRPAELALAAIRGHVNHAAAQSGAALDELYAEALQAASEAAAQGDEDGAARCLGLFLSAAELAIFQPNEIVAQILDAAMDGMPLQLRDRMRALRAAIAQARASGLPLSPALMLGAADPAGLERLGQDIRAAIAAKVDQIERLRFPFATGTEVRNALCRADGPIGEVGAAMRQPAGRGLAAVRAFRDRFGKRSAVVAAVMAAARGAAPRDSLDGSSRDRLVGHILDLVSLCGDHVAAADAAELMANPKRLAILKSVGAGLRKAAEAAAEALAAAAVGGGPVAATASAMAAAAASLPAVARGGVRQPGPIDHMVALHAPMLVLPSLDFGRGWLPEPYQVGEIIEQVMEAATPLLPPPGRERDERFAEAVRARVERGSFVGARLALDVAQHLEIGEEARDELGLKWDAELPNRRGWLAAEIVRVRQSIERVQRLGEGATPEECQALLAQLDTVAKASLPADIDVEARTDREESEERILDFPSAELVLHDIEGRTRAMLAEPAREIERRVGALVEAGSLDAEDAASVRSLLAEGDLVTARERLAVVEDGGRLPRTQVSANRRFAAFYPAVPDFVADLPAEAARGIPDAILAGRDLGPLAFSRIGADGRAEARGIYETWRKLPRELAAGDAQARAVPTAVGLLARFGFRVTVAGVDAALTRKQKNVVVNARIEFPTDDRDSLLLPDYGSNTEGNYRLVLAPRMPSEPEITALSGTAGVTATIILVTAAVDGARREELALGSSSIQGGRKVLVIDEALLLFALAEHEPRALTLVECAQPFGWARPYGDYGRYARVPPEMFFGRNAEYQALLAPTGSCVAFGGRRLGKTALLKHIEARENRPAEHTVVAYLQIEDLGRGERPVRLWHKASERLAAASAGTQPPVFASPVSSAEEFDRRVRAWLQQDSRRRVLLLLDEADEFVKEDAKQSFEEFRRLLRLMDETNRRFKFVLAGLHNVTRLVHAENSPLRQISSSPQLIGQLMDGDLGEAENLIVRPLAALGYAFDRREDVWSILSATNYYPVLAQTLCASLLDELRDGARRAERMDWTIRSETVRRILSSDKVLPSIKEKFNLTIKELDPRYELLTYVIAARTLVDQQEGRIEEGLTLAEVRDGAVEHWPAAMANHPNRLALVESLLEEMVGLGVVRRAKSGRWALRSPSILALLGSRDNVRELLAEFRNHEPDHAFEPGAMRRQLEYSSLAPGMEKGHTVPSPLTYGQEHDLLAGENPVTVFFGSDASDVGFAAAAIKQAAEDPADRRGVLADVRRWATLEDFLLAIRASREGGEASRILVVSDRSEWDCGWLVEALRAKPVRDGTVRVAFVGGPQHALRWVEDERVQTLPPGVRVVPLQTWSLSAVEDFKLRLDADGARVRTLLLDDLGGFNRPIRRATRELGPRGTIQKLERSVEHVRREDSIMADLGLGGEMGELFRRMRGWVNGGEIALLYLIEGALSGLPEAERAATARRVLDYGTLLGLFDAGTSPPNHEDESRLYAVNALLAHLLTPIEAAA